MNENATVLLAEGMIRLICHLCWLLLPQGLMHPANVLLPSAEREGGKR